MKKAIRYSSVVGAFVFGLLVLIFPGPTWCLTADHRGPPAFSSIPEGYFNLVRSSYRIFFGHTSHGSQIVTGLQMLNIHDPILYEPPVMLENDWTDLGDPAWPSITRELLADNPQINMVLWSWCGQLSWLTVSDVDFYLTQTSQLEHEYPRVIFVYMTGRLDGDGPSGALYVNNNRIRSYCIANNKVLFDFADIESYDPAGNYFPFGTDWCEWCETWCAINNCPTCDECAHSHCFNCFQKGKTFWWMMANIAGWQPDAISKPSPF